MADVIRIGNAQGFWGDSVDAPARLVAQAPDLNVLTLDYLAEVSMSILAKQRQRDASLESTRDFGDVIRSLGPAWTSGRKLKLVTNAGGLNPRGCADACGAALREDGVSRLKIGIVTGDDGLPMFGAAHAYDAQTDAFAHLETGAKHATIFDRLVTAN